MTQDLRRSVAVLSIVGLPSVLLLAVGALDVLDLFRLRRAWCALLVFGAGVPWGLGHILGALAAYATWGAVLLGTWALARLGLRLTRADAALRARARSELRLALLLLGGFGAMFLMGLSVNYTIAWLAFGAVWLVPGIRLLVAAARLRGASPRAQALAGGAGAALLALLLGGSALGLERLALSSERTIAVPRPSARHAWMRLGFVSSAGRAPAAVAFGDDGRSLLTRLEDGAVLAYDAGTGRPVAAPPAARFADGRVAAAAGGAVRLELLVDSGKVQLTGDGGSSTLAVHRPQKALGLAVSPDGRMLATAGTDNAVRLWELPSGQHRRTLLGHSNDVTAVAFSPDGSRLASGSVDGTLRIWRLR